jgi:hypothetical protein
MAHIEKECQQNGGHPNIQQNGSFLMNRSLQSYEESSRKCFGNGSRFLKKIADELASSHLDQIR